MPHNAPCHVEPGVTQCGVVAVDVARVAAASWGPKQGQGWGRVRSDGVDGMGKGRAGAAENGGAG